MLHRVFYWQRKAWRTQTKTRKKVDNNQSIFCYYLHTYSFIRIDTNSKKINPVRRCRPFNHFVAFTHLRSNFNCIAKNNQQAGKHKHCERPTFVSNNRCHGARCRLRCAIMPKNAKFFIDLDSEMIINGIATNIDTACTDRV